MSGFTTSFQTWYRLWQRAETERWWVHQWASHNFDPFTAWRISSCRLDYCLPFEVIRSLGPWYTVYSTAPLSQGPMTCWTSPSQILRLHAVQSRSLLESRPQREAVGAAGVCLPACFRVTKKNIILLNAKLRLWFLCSNYTTNLLKGHSTNFYTSKWVYLCVSCYFSTVHCQLKTHTKTSCSNSCYYLVKWHPKSHLIRLMYVLTPKFRMSYPKYFNALQERKTGHFYKSIILKNMF